MTIDMTPELYFEDITRQIEVWELPESEVSQAVQAQARIMAGLHLEPFWELPLDDPYQPLLF